MISIDRVYQKVLALANKEQRGYITPQEFNLFASHAQMDIFDQYFYDLEQRQRGPGNEFDYADMVGNIEEKISNFERYDVQVSHHGSVGKVDVSSYITDLYKMGTVRVEYAALGTGVLGRVVAEEIQLKELSNYALSPLATWSRARPVYTRFHTGSVKLRIQVFPYPIGDDSVYISYVRKPSKPNWTYLISGSNTKAALYNPHDAYHQDFELHKSEENNLVVKILQLAGVAIKDFNIVQMAAQEEANISQQQKQ